MPTTGIVERVDIDNVTFGVEIECYIPKVWAAEVSIRYYGGSAENGTINLTGNRNWEYKSDDSLGRINSEFCSIEFNSPVLNGKAGLQEVRDFVTILKENGARVKRDCGVHTHVGVKSLLGDTAHNFDNVARLVRNILRLVSQHEFGLYAMCNQLNRLNNEYARSIKNYNSRGLSSKTYSEFALESNGGYNRYHTVNVSSIWRRQTVEFRIFSGTVTPDKVVGYIMISLALMQRAAEAPLVHRFDNEIDVRLVTDDWETALVRLHRTLNWLPYRNNGYSHKCGVPTGAWRSFGLPAKRNQVWNARRFNDRCEEQHRYLISR